eukprot:TRINITY_DN2393_c0_g2_i1.p1 TRINITY_DN2393_c0_g2~~TRINITY_DN2393_c0_g2_i1.p1  ORF type:complete len:400 (-),score=103.05 TRINITY_DN2393_c0_g2_i1:87-1286(-)
MAAATDQVLNTVGFQRTKVGSDDKETGYVIKRWHLHRVFGVLAFGCTLLFSLLLWSQYEIRIERRSFLSNIRSTAQKGDAWASKLAKVEMQLWAHYQRDIQESEEAKQLTERLNESYNLFKSQLNEKVQIAAKEADMPADKAADVATRLAQIVLKHRHEDLRNIEGLIEDLITAGVRSTALEKHIDREGKKELKEAEEEAMETENILKKVGAAEKADRVENTHNDMKGGKEPQDEEYDSAALDAMLTNVFDLWVEFEQEFPGPYPALKEGSPLWKRIKTVQEDSESKVEAETALKKLGLEEMKLGFVEDKSVFMQNLHQYVDMLLVIEQIPREKVRKLRRHFLVKDIPQHIIMGKLRAMGERRLPLDLFLGAVSKEEETDAQVVFSERPITPTIEEPEE